ncbi:MAG: DUF6111 family protein [Bauldia sp.]
MIRFIALTAVLFAIPFAAYWLWVLASKRRLPRGEDWRLGITLILCVFGAIFVLIGLVILVEDARRDAEAGETAAITTTP